MINNISQKNNELITLIQTNDVEITKKFIIDNVINIDEIDKEEHPLIFALKNGISDSIIQFLISLCKNLNFELNNGETPLSIALSFKKISIAKKLLDNGFDINYINKYKENALIYLMKVDEISRLSLSFLLNNNIDINVKDEDGRNALMYAVENDKLQLVKDILEFYIMDNKFIINLLLMKKQQIKSSCSYLSKRINKEYKKINIDDTDDEGNSALLLACDHRNEKIINLLLKFGANVNARDIYGETPLLRTCKDGNYLRAQYLIQYGANIKVTDFFLNTPLALACKYGHSEIAELLLKNGANINVRNSNGDTPINLSCISLFFDPENKTYNIVKLLTEHGADVNIPNKNKSTPLTLASEAGEKGIVEILLKHGANVNTIDKDGDSPLTLAREGHFNDIEELLIKYGAKLWLNKKKLLLAFVLLYLYVFYFLQNINIINRRSKKLTTQYY